MEIVTFVELDIGGTTFRFGYASEEGLGYDYIPSLTSVRVKPAVVDPGESIGERESVTVQCIDHLHRFDSDNFEDGTFWTKFRARYASIEGSPLRVLRGIRGQSLSDMDTYLYVAQSLQMSRTGATIIAKDPLTLLNSKAAQAPLVTQGELLDAISDSDMSLTLSPVGIGNLQYPASGKAVIGGSELVSFTRVGDVVTLTSRGENTAPSSHEAESKFQLALVYDSVLPSVIVYDLLTNYTEIDPSWITLSDWQTSVDAFVNRVYSATIVEPTAVKKLLDELCEQIGLIFFWDSLAKQIRMRPLLAAATSRLIREEIMLDGSLEVTEQPDKRVSQVWTFYGQRDPVRPLDEVSNYRRVVVKVAPNENDYAQPAIRKIFSRWINFSARSTAEKLNDLIISRYQIPPRKFGFRLFRNEDLLAPPIGAQIDVRHWFLVDADGVQVTEPALITSVRHDDAELNYEAEEVRFAGQDFDPEVDKYVFIDGDVFNVNLRDLYDDIYTAPNSGDTIYFVIETGVKVGGLVRTVGGVLTPSLDVGDWPEPGITLVLINNGRIQGIGGEGGDSATVSARQQGSPGGTALFTRQAITVENNGEIWGGGGGGSVRVVASDIGSAYSVGGGGAGYLPGQHGRSAAPEIEALAQDGTTEAGGNGAGNRSSAGGGPGQPGVTADGSVLGGAAGIAIDGVSYITFSVSGSVLGQQIN